MNVRSSEYTYEGRAGTQTFPLRPDNAVNLLLASIELILLTIIMYLPNTGSLELRSG